MRIGGFAVCGVLLCWYQVYIYADSTADALYSTHAPVAYDKHVSQWRRRDVRCSCTRLSQWVDILADDVVDFHRNIFTMTSLKIVVATLPFYMAFRPMD